MRPLSHSVISVQFLLVILFTFGQCHFNSVIAPSLLCVHGLSNALIYKLNNNPNLNGGKYIPHSISIVETEL